MSMDKIASIPLETTAYYQSLTDLNIQFWNQDKDTSTLQFKITRNNYPLALSEENIKIFIALESKDSFLVDDKLKFVDELNGVIDYKIPDEFMKIATRVIGQVYVTTLDEEQVVVQRKFAFNVENDLIAELPAENKLREIKYFSDMRSEVADMIKKLNDDFEHMNDYVTKVQETTEQGLLSLNNLISTKESDYNTNHSNRIKEINEKGTQYSKKFDDDKKYIDTKFEDFKKSVSNSEVITTGQTANWQRYKLTEADGKSIFTNLNNDLEKLRNLTPGYFYCTNIPISGATSTAGFVIVEMRDTSVKRITFSPYNSTDQYLMRFYNSWSDWERVGIDPNNVETPQNSQAKANTAENNAKVYTDLKYSKRHTVLFEGNANGVGTPINLSEPLDSFIVLYIYGDFPGGEFVTLGNPLSTRNINLNLDNIVGLDAISTSTYECSLAKVNNQQLKINSDNYMNIIDGSSSGANANKFTVQKIVGVYK